MTEISQNAARRIASSVTAVERLQYSSIAKTGNLPTTNYGSYLVKTPSGGIPARSGDTLGNADCTIQVIDKATNVVTDGETLNVLNLSSTVVSGNIYVKAVRTKTGDYVVEISISNNGVVRGKAEVDFTSTTATVDVEVTFSNLSQVIVGQVVTATNHIGYEGDRDGECYVYYHGDGTGNEDGTFELMGARCPA